MTAFQILDVKDFMSKLLLKETFDSFALSELTITTGITYTIDGLLHPEFYQPQDAEALHDAEQTHISWQEVRSYCFSIIKGKQVPLSFRIVFMLAAPEISHLLSDSGLSLTAADITGLYLNCQFDRQGLTLVTGTALRFFTLDKSLDRAWDARIRTFLLQQQVAYEEV